MATITDLSNTAAEVDNYNKTLRVGLWPSLAAYSAGGISGLIAAATNGTLWAARYNQNAASNVVIYITRLYLNWTTTTAFTTPGSVRSLLISKSSVHATPTAVTTIVPIAKHPSDQTSGFNTNSNGLITICTTAALTITGITWDTASVGVFDMTSVGSANTTKTLDWNAVDGGGPIILLPGQLIGVRTNGALDAAGVGVLVVNMEWMEGTL